MSHGTDPTTGVVPRAAEAPARRARSGRGALGAAVFVVAVIAALCAETMESPLYPFPMPDFLRTQYWHVAAVAAAVVVVLDAVGIVFLRRRIRALGSGAR